MADYPIKYGIFQTALLPWGFQSFFPRERFLPVTGLDLEWVVRENSRREAIFFIHCHTEWDRREMAALGHLLYGCSGNQFRSVSLRRMETDVIHGIEFSLRRPQDEIFIRKTASTIVDKLYHDNDIDRDIHHNLKYLIESFRLKYEWCAPPSIRQPAHHARPGF